MIRRALAALLSGALLAACAAPPPRTTGAAPPKAPLPYRLAVQVSSQVQGYYYVTSGPIDSYARFRVGDRFAALVEEVLERRSDPAGARTAEVEVELLGFETEYREVGAADRPAEFRLAAATVGGAGAGVVPAGLFGSGGEGGDLGIPHEVIKSAHATAAVRIRLEGGAVTERQVKASHTEVVYWDDQIVLDRFGFRDVVELTLRKAALEVEKAVESVLAPSQRT